MSPITATRPSSPPDSTEPLAAELVLDIAVGLARARTLWEGRVRQDLPARHSIRLLSHDRYEAWLIGWPADHRTTPHDHGASVGALVVVDGRLFEGTTDDEGRTAHRHLVDGETIVLPAGIVHDVGTLDGPAISIHVYSPPLSTMTFYDDGTGLPDHVLDVVEEHPVLAARDVARALHPAARTSDA